MYNFPFKIASVPENWKAVNMIQLFKKVLFGRSEKHTPVGLAETTLKNGINGHTGNYGMWEKQ